MNRQQIIDAFKDAKEEYRLAEKAMVEEFSGYKKLLNEGEFQKAKEYLRYMPDSCGKTLCFVNIIKREDGSINFTKNKILETLND